MPRKNIEVIVSGGPTHAVQEAAETAEARPEQPAEEEAPRPAPAATEQSRKLGRKAKR